MAEMGLLGLPFSEEDGGVGAGPVEIGIVCQELGRVIAPEPYLTSVVLAGGLVSACGTAEQRQELLGALSAGESVLAFAHDEPGSQAGQPHARRAGHAPSQDGDSWTLTGVKEPVPHGARADVLVVSAALPDGGTGLFWSQGDAPERSRLPDVRRRPRRQGRPSTAPRRRRWASPGRDRDREHLDGPGHRPGDGRQPGARRDAVPAARPPPSTSAAASSSASRSTPSRR